MSMSTFEELGIKIRDYIKSQHTYYNDRVYFYASQFDYLLDQGKPDYFAIISFEGSEVIERTGRDEEIYNYSIRCYRGGWKKEEIFTGIAGTKTIGKMVNDLKSSLHDNTTIPGTVGVCMAKVKSILATDSTLRLGANAEHYNASGGISIQYRLEEK